MKKILIIILLAVAAIGAAVSVANENKLARDYKDATYTIDNVAVTLRDGVSSRPAAEGSETMIVTRYFGNEATGDLDRDGREDAAFLLTQETGGSGTFYYLAVAKREHKGYRGLGTVYLGDRIAPQSTEYADGGIVVNYAERRAGEPMTAAPSVGRSAFFKIVNGELVQVERNFEGEADPSRMTLDMKPWVWIRTELNDGSTVSPKKQGAFVLTFAPGNRFSAQTDCNSAGGSYTAKDGQISFSEMMSTLMFCEGSQETEFTNMLANSSSYHFTSRGELILDLKFDSGSVIFR